MEFRILKITIFIVFLLSFPISSLAGTFRSPKRAEVSLFTQPDEKISFELDAILPRGIQKKAGACKRDLMWHPWYGAVGAPDPDIWVDGWHTDIDYNRACGKGPGKTRYYYYWDVKFTELDECLNTNKIDSDTDIESVRFTFYTDDWYSFKWNTETDEVTLFEILGFEEFYALKAIGTGRITEYYTNSAIEKVGNQTFSNSVIPTPCWE